MVTEAQRAQFWGDGYVVIEDAIPPAALAAARQCVEEHWRETGETVHLFTDPAVQAAIACFCPLAATLWGKEPERFTERHSGLAIHSLPSTGEWGWPTPHIDGALKKDDKTVDPGPFIVATMVYLTDVAPQGGGTIVWPRSHHVLQAAYAADPVKYHKMYDLNEDLMHGVFPLEPPVELTPKAGSVLFYHLLTAHAGSKNIQSTPRLAFNTKWW